MSSTSTLAAASLDWGFSDDLYHPVGTRALYNPLHGVACLGNEYREWADAGSWRRVQVTGKDDRLLAFSTYFYQTLHWWQRIGSTTGLMLTMGYPAQSQSNPPLLLEVLRAVGARKSLRSFIATQPHRLPQGSRCALDQLLRAWHNLEFSRRMILDPLRLQGVISSPFFECVGQSLASGLIGALSLLSALFDPELKFLPDYRRWGPEFEHLKKKKVRGFYHGTDLSVAPLGARRLFEGQARFNQFQLLHLASNGRLNWEDFTRLGLMEESYLEVFRRFLEWADLDWPNTPVEPAACLFLLLCHLAINPCDGYPFEVGHFESFVQGHDPTFRFSWFCQRVAEEPALKRIVRRCTKDEFLEVSTGLCRSLGCRQPVEIGQQIQSWVRQVPALQQLLRQDESFTFPQDNLPVRVCFARHLRFAQDRANSPEVFCWPAMHLVEPPAGVEPSARALELWNRHQPLFLADDAGAIRRQGASGPAAAELPQAFRDFFSGNVLNDVVRQWLVTDGPFDLDYAWLSPSCSARATKALVEPAFQTTFGASFDSFSP